MMGDILWMIVGLLVGYLLATVILHRDTRRVKWVASPHGRLPVPTDAQLRAARDEFAPGRDLLHVTGREHVEHLSHEQVERLRTIARESSRCGYVWVREPLCVDCGWSKEEHGQIAACSRYRSAFSSHEAVPHPNPAAHRCLLTRGHIGVHVCECLALDPLLR